MNYISFISISAFYVTLFQAATSYGASTTIYATQEATPTYCSCQYNVPYEAEAYCRSYGQLGDDVLIPWYRANQTCLDEYQIKVVAIDRDVLFEICPYENSTDVDIQLLLNEIRYNPSPATRAIQASYPLFWVESSTNVGLYELVEVIYDGRNNPNCTVSETICYSTIREYFTINPSELGTACKEFHARNRFDMDLEQSAIRIRLCQEVDTTISTGDSSIPSCEPLVSQVIEIKNKNPSTACSAFGLGPGTQELPTISATDCSAVGNATSSQSTSGTTGKTVTTYKYHSLLVCLIATILTCSY